MAGRRSAGGRRGMDRQRSMDGQRRAGKAGTVRKAGAERKAGAAGRTAFIRKTAGILLALMAAVLFIRFAAGQLIEKGYWGGGDGKNCGDRERMGADPCKRRI